MFFFFNVSVSWSIGFAFLAFYFVLHSLALEQRRRCKELKRKASVFVAENPLSVVPAADLNPHAVRMSATVRALRPLYPSKLI